MKADKLKKEINELWSNRNSLTPKTNNKIVERYFQPSSNFSLVCICNSFYRLLKYNN